MAYDHVLAQRIEELLPNARGKSMFGGRGYFQEGNMFAGVMGDRLMVKLGEDAVAVVETEVDVELFSPGGKTMSGWVTVDQELVPDDDDLLAWLERGLAVVAKLPPK